MSVTEQVKQPSTPKPKLVKIGEHYVCPNDVAGFKLAKKGLYILRLKSDPNPNFPLWLERFEMEAALEFFDVTVTE